MNNSNYSFKEQYAAFFWALLLVIFITSGLIVVEWTENKRFLENQRRSIVEQLSTIRAKLEGTLNAELLLARSLIAVVATETDITKDRFFKISNHFFKASKHIRNIGLAKGTILTYVYPVEGNEGAIGIDYKKVVSQWPAVKQAIEERKTIVAGPLNLVQGGIAIIGRTPIYIDNDESGIEEYFGILSVVINIPSLFEEAGLDNKDSLLKISIKGKDGLGAKGEVFYGSKDLFSNDPVLMEITLPEGNWLMAATPVSGWEKTSVHIPYYRIVALVIGVVILFLLFIQQREIYSRKKAEEALFEQEAHYRALFENSSDAIFILNASGIFMSVNPATLGMFGFQTERELIKQSLDIVSPEFQPNGDLSSQEAQKMMKQAHINGVSDFEWVHKRSNGEVFYTHVRLAPILQDKEVMFQAAIRDFTKQKQLEKEIIFINERLTEQNKIFKEFATKDKLTGIHNRRSFYEFAEEQWSKAVRNQLDCSIIMIDIDHFKKVNDTYGHLTGDMVLKDTVKIIDELNRDYDRLGRWGGEEFILFLPDTSIENALTIAERIRKKVEGGKFYVSDELKISVTISLGVTSKQLSDTLELDVLFDCADKALYNAKETGRNKVCSFKKPK